MPMRIHRTLKQRALSEAKPLSPHTLRKRGRPTKPKTDAESESQTLSAELSRARTRVSNKDRLFVDQYIAQGFKDPQKAAETVGFKDRGIGWKLVQRLSHLIEGERARAYMSTIMSVEEAMRGVAELGRTGGAIPIKNEEGQVVYMGGDAKLKLAALRTVLEVEGALGKGAPTEEEKRKTVRAIEELVSRLKAMKKAPTENQLGTGEQELSLDPPIEVEVVGRG